MLLVQEQEDALPAVVVSGAHCKGGRIPTEIAFNMSCLAHNSWHGHDVPLQATKGLLNALPSNFFLQCRLEAITPQ